MGLDWRLIDTEGRRVLDIQGFGVWLQNHVEDGGLRVEGVLM